MTKNFNELGLKKHGANSDYTPAPQPEFEPIIMVNEVGGRYAKEFYLTEDLQNASKKFQNMFKKYTEILLTTTPWKGETLKIKFAYNKLLRLQEKEHIKRYSEVDREKCIDDYYKNETIRFQNWKSQQKANKTKEVELEK